MSNNAGKIEMNPVRKCPGEIILAHLEDTFIEIFQLC